MRADVVIRVKVTPEQRDRLVAAARQNAATMTDVIRDAVDDYVSDYSDDVVFAQREWREERGSNPQGLVASAP